MRNKIFAITLTFIMVISMVLSTSAAVNVLDKFDAPTPGGDRIWGAERMLKHELTNEGFYSGINNGVTPHPKTGNPSTYHGVQMYLDQYKEEKCIRVELAPDKVTGYFDVGYYSHAGDSYRRSLEGKYSWLRVRYAYNEEAGDIDCMTTWARPDEDVLGAATVDAGMKTWDIANGEGEWMDTVIYVGDIIFGNGFTWEESTIRQFRVQMFEYNENPEAVCYIAGFGFFETEEEAKAYDFANAPSEMGADVDTSVNAAVTETVTAVVTEAPTEAVTEVPTEAVTEAPTEALTEAATEAPIEAATESSEEETSAESSEAADATDEDTAEEVSETETGSAQEESETTESEPTESETVIGTDGETAEDTTVPAATEPAPSETGLALPIGIAAVIVIAAVIIILLKKKKA